jgi:hypothetical protein
MRSRDSELFSLALIFCGSLTASAHLFERFLHRFTDKIGDDVAHVLGLHCGLKAKSIAKVLFDAQHKPYLGHSLKHTRHPWEWLRIGRHHYNTPTRLMYISVFTKFRKYT